MITDDVPRGLRTYFREHNRRTVLLAGGCLLGSALSWSLVYGVILWAELFFLTTTRGVEAPSSLSVQTHFLCAAVVLLIVGGIVRKWRTQDEKFNLGVALITLLSIPARLTFAVLENLQARIQPSESELRATWEMLQMIASQKKIAVSHLATLLTGKLKPARIVYLVSITGLIDTDEYGGIFYHHLRNPNAEELVANWSDSLRLENSETTSSRESIDSLEAE